MKGWRTILFNVLSAILLIAENQGVGFGLSTELVSTIILVGNFLLRLITTTPVGKKELPKDDDEDPNP